jgi:DNA-binding LacI/PurR family transcriptional regulator
MDIAGYPSVSIDSYSGMKDALLHLIKEHNFTKIAFIRGPEHHVYAQQRYQAYLDVHREFNIKIDEHKVSAPGSWEKESGIDAINYFLIQNKLRIKDDIEAIAGANDYLVIGAVEELKNVDIKYLVMSV